MFCAQCGKKQIENAEYCPHCGEAYSKTEGDAHQNKQSHARVVYVKKRSNTLLIVVVVVLFGIAGIGLLSTLAVVSLNSAREKSRDAKRISDIKQIQTALELYYADNNGYPAVGTTVDLGDAGNKCFDEDGFMPYCDLGDTTYMSQIPINPTPGGSSYSYTSYLGKNDMSDCSSVRCDYYIINFATEGTVGGLNSGFHQATPQGIDQID